MPDGHPRYHLIQHVDGNAGFCALLTYTLNGIRMAVRDEAIPVVYYGEGSTRFFYEPAHGDNVWEYYFEPVAPVGYGELIEALARGELSPEQIHSFAPKQIFTWHHTDPERIATFWAKDVPDDPVAWMAAKRALGRKYVSEWIRVKPHILDKVEAFWSVRIRPQFTIGVHIRGTDFSYAEPTSPQRYFEEIDRLLEERSDGSYGIFLATDQTQFVDLFHERYGDRVITWDSLRGSRSVAPFKFSGESPYRRGEDVLIDLLLMSRCDFLFKGAAAVGEYALWFNPSLECCDFALESQFDPRRFSELVSAYRKLEIKKWSPPLWSPRRWRFELEQGPGALIQRLWRSLRKRVGLPLRQGPR